MTVTMREMLEAGVHFGHQTRFWNPKMAPYIYGHRNKIHIINLEKTQPLFNDAMKFIRQLAAKRGTILMIGTKRQAREVIALEAQRAGMPFVDQRWLGGMLTNFKTVKGSLKKLKDMQAQIESGTEIRIKKEALMFQRELAKLEKDIGGIQDMNALPDALFVIDVGYHKIAVAEAKKLGIPVIGVVDSNHSPEGIDYVIPGNDDSSKAVALYARAVADAVLEGKANADQRGGAGCRRRRRRVRGSRRTRPERSPRLASRRATERGCYSPFFQCPTCDTTAAARTPWRQDSRRTEMAAITASMVAELRAKTDAPMMECKKALTEADGDMDRAEETAARQARQQGRQGRRRASPPKAWSPRPSTARPARWSRSTARPTSSRRTNRFLAFVKAAAELVAKNNPADVAALSALPYAQDGFGPTLEDVRKGLIGKIGENMSIRRFKRYAGGGKLANYLHGTRIGVIVEFAGDDVAAKDVAMHVAAMKPAALSRPTCRPSWSTRSARSPPRRPPRAASRPTSSPRWSRARCRST